MQSSDETLSHFLQSVGSKKSTMNVNEEEAELDFILLVRKQIALVLENLVHNDCIADKKKRMSK